ncbi:hypothetical protein PHLGIDRAFT_21438 [Phlebiopsis gigantea 11061_1 CR5-6]|uniref:MARVEL domain-containing protein n=1 Tax=Phlebiopsis gigantea (strain 11061_1 CR5-6) TaxID=745531 RepID=A0A0C3SDD0_PHLG1|nr:hypothetical protein PHLGIDRAFT_21438 [Phlebiopsis gigantea 11061_1 CR5-6]
MWCDNCLLLFPLRVGAMVWAFFIMLYSVAGSIFLLKWGQFLYFVYPEWDIYGGIGMAVGLLCLITIFALGNRSYVWTRAVKFLWPFVIVISGVRAILMIVELQRGKDNIQWECDNGGVLWTDADSTSTDATDSGTLPAGFCSTGFANLYAAFIVALLVDLGFQVYMFFMVWRYQKRLEHYQNMKGPFGRAYY